MVLSALAAALAMLAVPAMLHAQTGDAGDGGKGVQQPADLGVEASVGDGWGRWAEEILGDLGLRLADPTPDLLKRWDLGELKSGAVVSATRTLMRARASLPEASRAKNVTGVMPSGRTPGALFLWADGFGVAGSFWITVVPSSATRAP